jgi:hypothetical protein
MGCPKQPDDGQGTQVLRNIIVEAVAPGFLEDGLARLNQLNQAMVANHHGHIIRNVCKRSAWPADGARSRHRPLFRRVANQ